MKTNYPEVLFALLLLVVGHIGFAVSHGLGLWDLVLLDAWLLPVWFAAGEQSSHFCAGTESGRAS